MYDRTPKSIKFRAFLLVSGEKDHHAAKPDCSKKHILLKSFIFFFLLVKGGEIVTELLTVLRIYQY